MRRTKEQAEQTRQDLLQSALELFVHQGYIQTSISQIASRAKVTRGALYYHFMNKAEILKALACLYLAPIFEAAQSALLAEQQVWKNLEQTLVTMFTDILDNPNRQAFFRIMHEQCGSSEDVRQIMREYDELFQQQSALMVEKGKLEGAIHQQLDAGYVHLHIGSMMNGLVSCYLTRCHEFSKEQALLVIRRTMASFNAS
ncbi:MAG: TetR family transcriptional regulator [Cardiobacteriaceae bacterium]|nr:TetR family transcriptional regulator [Cardiobacteriaceae bacterium]